MYSIKWADHRFYMSSHGELMTNIGNLCQGFALNPEIQIEKVTHIMYNLHSSTHYAILNMLFNLEFLAICKTINVAKINFDLLPELQTLYLTFDHLRKDNLSNLPNTITTLFVDVSDYQPIDLFHTKFLFDNIPPNLTKFVFFCGTRRKRSFDRMQEKIIFGIKQNKIPFNCKICFFKADLNSYNEYNC
jgi:hypothetical protein